MNECCSKFLVFVEYKCSLTRAMGSYRENGWKIYKGDGIPEVGQTLREHCSSTLSACHDEFSDCNPNGRISGIFEYSSELAEFLGLE